MSGEKSHGEGGDHSVKKALEFGPVEPYKVTKALVDQIIGPLFGGGGGGGHSPSMEKHSGPH